MAVSISRETGKFLWDGSLEAFAFAGVGYLCGKGVNLLNKFTSLPSFFSKSEGKELKKVSFVCGLFITIDQIVHKILLSNFDNKEVNKPIYTAIRIGLNSYIAIKLFNLPALIINDNKIELKKGFAVIFITCIVYTLIHVALRVFNDR